MPSRDEQKVLLVPGDCAPAIQSQAVRSGEIVEFSLDDALKGADYLLLVFYPADFTFVCPTEIIQFAERHSEFEQQRCNIVCCSTDSVYTHLAWLKAPKTERGLGGNSSSSIVLLSDRSHEISCAYGVLASSGAAYRGTFLIDKSKTICQVTINDMPVGRSVDDALRMLTELRKKTAQNEKKDPASSSNSSNARTAAAETVRQSFPGQQLKQHRQHRQRHTLKQQNTIHLQHNISIPQSLSHSAGFPPGPAADDGSDLVAQYGCRQQQNNQCQFMLHQQPSEQQQQIPSSPTSDPSSDQSFNCAESSRGIPHVTLAACAAQLETRAAQLRLQDCEERLARVLKEADRLLAETQQQQADTERLKTDAQLKQNQLDRLAVAEAKDESRVPVVGAADVKEKVKFCPPWVM